MLHFHVFWPFESLLFYSSLISSSSFYPCQMHPNPLYPCLIHPSPLYPCPIYPSPIYLSPIYPKNSQKGECLLLCLQLPSSGTRQLQLFTCCSIKRSTKWFMMTLGGIGNTEKSLNSIHCSSKKSNLTSQKSTISLAMTLNLSQNVLCLTLKSSFWRKTQLSWRKEHWFCITRHWTAPCYVTFFITSMALWHYIPKLPQQMQRLDKPLWCDLSDSTCGYGTIRETCRNDTVTLTLAMLTLAMLTLGLLCRYKPPPQSVNQTSPPPQN